MLQKVNLSTAFAGIDKHWDPRLAGELNGQHVRLVKLLGEFEWHHHASEDELFLVVSGSFCLKYRDENGAEVSLNVSESEFVIVPRGVEHKPVAATEARVLLFEPAATINTGNVRSGRTVEYLKRL